MATITTRKGKTKTTYLAAIRKRGHKPVNKTFTRKSDAKRWARHVESAIERGEYGLISEAEKHTLAELIDHYLKTEQNPTARESVLEWWRDEIGHKKLSQITPALLSEYKTKLLNTSGVNRVKKRSASTVNRYMAYLSILYKQAVNEYQWCNENPLRKVTKLKEPSGRVRFLNNDERKALLTECKKNPMLYELVVMALTTGARAGELLHLEWQDIDFMRGTAVLHNTKNGERRSIPVCGEVAELLKKRRGIGLVFSSRSGNAVFEYSKPFRKAVQDSGIKSFRFHDCRHTAASYLAQNHWTLLEIATFLGHKTISMVKRYSHLVEEETVQSSGKLLSGIIES